MSAPRRPYGAHPAPEQAYLEAMRVSVTELLGEFAASRMDYRLRRAYAPPALAHRLAVDVLARCTGPRRYTDSRSASVELVRFASWWDHFKATYRRRWWMRWRRWRVQYTLREATAVATVTVEADIAAVFPHAGVLPPALGEAYPVVLGRTLP